MNIASSLQCRTAPILRGRARRLLTPLALMLALAGTAHAAEGGFKHEVLMRGQILEAEAGSLVVCIGKRDGAEVGQQLDVVRHTRVGHQHKSPSPRFHREAVGSVRITSLFDEHYATAEVVDGEPKVNDTVELVRR